MANYTIKRGDTLSSIASQYNTTPEDLMTANKGGSAIKNKNLIVAGGTLNLPEVGVTAPAKGIQPITPVQQPGSTVPVAPVAPVKPAPSATTSTPATGPQVGNTNSQTIPPPGVKVTPPASTTAAAGDKAGASASATGNSTALGASTVNILKSAGATFNSDGSYTINGKNFDSSGNPIQATPISAQDKTLLTNAGATFNADGSYSINGQNFDASGNPVQGPGAVSSSALPSDDWSAGFASYAEEMANLGSGTDALNQDYMATEGAIQNPDGTWNYNPTPEEVAQHQQTLSSIGQNAQSSRGDVQSAAATAELQSKKAGELLGMGPAAIKYNIGLYQDQSNQLFKSIADAFNSINEDQNTATINEDYQYAQNLQAEKLNLLQVQRQAITDKSSFLTNAFNIMLGGKQESRLEASDAITKVQNLYQLGQVPSPSDWTAAGFAGKPPAALNLQVWTPPVMSDGKMMQTNTQTGEVRVLSTSLFASLDPVTASTQVSNAVTAINDGTATIADFTDPTERAAIVAEQAKTEAANASSTDSSSNPLGDIWNWLTHSGSSSSTSSAAPASNAQSEIDSNTAAIEQLGSQLQGMQNLN